jgi:hypothetical protein
LFELGDSGGLDRYVRLEMRDLADEVADLVGMSRFGGGEVGSPACFEGLENGAGVEPDLSGVSH